jgi:predicted polyphosphate/ATP-dependent NAD kinase
MGQEACAQVGIQTEVIGSIQSGATTAADTQAAVRSFIAEDVGLILFAGGDGTACDIYQAIADRFPVLGIPAGVKIHSAVYAVTPCRAGHIALSFLQASNRRTRLAEVMDIDEDAFRDGRLRARLFGYLCVPDDQRNMQHAKAGFRSEREALLGITGEIVGQMKHEPDTLFIFGPGTTTGFILEALNLTYSLLGVDVVKRRKLIQRDANEGQLLTLIQDRPTKIVVTAIGGQGHILGRGNQQISPAVIRAVGVENLIVIATTQKLISLRGRPLIVDTGSEALNESLRGYRRVITGLGEWHIVKVE